MQNYWTIQINCSEDFKDILIAELDQLGYEGFIETDLGFEACIVEENFDKQAVDQLFNQYLDNITEVKFTKLEQQNWNEEWEKNFEPVLINEKIRIRAPFHPSDASFPIELVIQPKTSFGTGHHETTSLIMQLMAEIDFSGKKVFDFGSGTGILAILAIKLGAARVVANDIDSWAAENIFENMQLNKVDSIQFIHGGLESVEESEFDVVIANINRNILCESMESLSLKVKPGCPLFISGFYESDLPVIMSAASPFRFELKQIRVENSWCTAMLEIPKG